MKKLLETVGFVLAALGGAGVVQHYFGWFRLWAVTRHLTFLDGYLLWTNIGLLLIGATLMFASDSIHEPH
ncbi:hypothetical protein [Yinghuangia seranimata]|uniref:hypothetical protein n=1 Tax=Yinghuangia seranimata TaxID=408067 RepID=UPI00248B2D54|nr:hypothetical protein [Yinghuangia seranimata]MDI2124934.1 hypothetical protein [Yinghuangia seranimata]